MKSAFFTYVFGNSLIEGMISKIILPLLLVSIGLNASKIGVLYAVAGLIAMFVLIFTFSLSDYKGLRFAIVIVSVSLIITSFFIATKILIFIAIAICTLDIAFRGEEILRGVFCIKTFKKTLSQMSGILFVVSTIGSVLAPVIAGVVLVRFGFSLAAVVCGIGAIGMLFLIPFIQNIKHKERRSEQRFKPSKKFIVLVAHKFLALAGIGIIWSFALPLYFKDVHHLSIESIGISLGVITSAVIIGNLLGKVADKYNYKIINYAGLIIASLLFISMIFVSNLYLVLALIWLSQFLINFAGTAVMRFYAEVVNRAGKEISIIHTVGDNAGTAMASFLSGLIISSLGYQAIFPIAGIILLASVGTLAYGFGFKIKS